MKKRLMQFAAMFVVVFILVSCGGTAPAPTQDVNVVMTSAIDTMVAAFFLTQTAVVPPATATPLPSQTPLPTATLPPVPTATFPPPPTAVILVFPTLTTPLATVILGTPGTMVTATINPITLGSGCNNLGFIRDVTIPAGTVLKPGENFTKTWKVQNTGTCEWLYQYSLVLVSGPEFSAGDTKLGKIVTVGDWSELSLNMDAPAKEGDYVAYWRLSDGVKPFGATLEVSFKVVK